tara:strand:+ start:100 stop:273 length:174 start_codon:yes stop_codon:yes gene_type:complete
MKIIIVNDNDKPKGKKSRKYKKRHFKKKAKKRIADDIESPVKKEDWDFAAYGKRLTN